MLREYTVATNSTKKYTVHKKIFKIYKQELIISEPLSLPSFPSLYQ